jgi:hypothetical protein
MATPREIQVEVLSPKLYNLYLNDILGRAMAQAVTRRPLTVEARIRSRVSPRRICGGQSGTGTGLSPSTSAFPCRFHCTGTPLHGINEKLILFITGLHNKLQGCGASVASAAGPFTTKKKYPPTRHTYLAHFSDGTHIYVTYRNEVCVLRKCNTPSRQWSRDVSSGILASI